MINFGSRTSGSKGLKIWGKHSWENILNNSHNFCLFLKYRHMKGGILGNMMKDSPLSPWSKNTLFQWVYDVIWGTEF